MKRRTILTNRSEYDILKTQKQFFTEGVSLHDKKLKGR